MSENIKTPSTPPFTPFQVHVISSSTQKTKLRDSPTLSILKTPTLYFGSGRNSSRRTRKLKFANGPIDLESIRKSRDGSHDSIVSTDSSNCSEDRKAHNGQIEAEESFVEVAVSPKKSMKVSPESWTAFLEYKKFNDYANETEKTDYTYSRLSKYRHKEIIPGFRIRPNLSRSPLGRSTNLDSSSSDYSYSSDFYASFQYEKGLRYRVKSLNLDSEDEVDISTTNLNQSSFFSRVASKVARVFIAIYVSISNYVASAANNVKYYFQKYILRRKNVSKYSSTSFWVPYSPAEYYYSPSCYSEPTSYFTRFRSSVYRSHERIATFVHVASQTVIDYVKAKHSGASRRRKLLWLFLPFLLLAGLWLLNNEKENGYVVKQWREIDLSSSLPFAAVKDGGGKMADFVREKCHVVTSKLTESFGGAFSATFEYFKSVHDFFTSAFSVFFESFLFYISSFSNFLYDSLVFVFNSISDLWIFFLDFLIRFFSNLFNGVSYGINYVYELIIDSIFVFGDYLSSGFRIFRNLFTGFFDYLKTLLLYSITFSSDSGHESRPEKSEFSQQKELFEQHKAIERLSRELKDFKELSGELAELKRKIDDLELEFRKEKEAREAGEEVHSRQLEENYKQFQKYQVTVNRALRRCCVRGNQLSNLSIRHVLNEQSEEMKKWIAANFLTKEDAGVVDENKIAALIADGTNKTGEDLKILRAEFEKFVKEHKTELVILKQEIVSNRLKGNVDGNVSVDFIRKIVNDAIKLYDADKTAKVDYALESAGGQVQSIRCTETYTKTSKSYILLGLPVYTLSSSPRDAINPGTAPGQCWAFVGSQGYLVLQLSHTIHVNGFTMEHISRSLSPHGKIDSAPKNFSMWGLKNESDMDPYLFGEYTFEDNEETIQYFPVARLTDEPYKFVELKILSNHGNPEYTCLYRIRIHGKPI